MPSKINADGSVTDWSIEVTGSKAQDLGLNGEWFNMAAGAVVLGNWIDNVEWVRNLVVLTQSDQQYDIGIGRRDKSLTADFTTWLSVNSGALTSASWRPFVYTGNQAVLGYSARFAIKNSAAVPNTFARHRVQLLGL